MTSSFELEVAATEFKCQGLELDYVGLCWGWDLVRDDLGTSWVPRRFDARSNKWGAVKAPDRHRFALNSYRVLLTRARRGLVIWVPPGDSTDPTAPPEEMDLVARALVDAGAKPFGRPTKLPMVGEADGHDPSDNISTDAGRGRLGGNAAIVAREYG